MSPDKTLYVCGFTSSEISEIYDMDFYSIAGKHKKRNIVKSLQTVGTDVTMVSPLLFTNNTFSYYSGRRVVDEETGATVYIPPAIDVYAANFLFAILATTFLTLRLLRSNSYDMILFYNFRAKHAIPATLGALLSRTPAILDYEDGIFLHDSVIIRWSGKLLSRACAPVVDGAICVNRPLAALAPTENVVIVRGFPSVGFPEELPNPKQKTDATIVMFAGRLDTIRGVDNFIDAIPNISPDGPVKFWISGYGSESDFKRVQNRVDEINDERVTFFGTLQWQEYRERLVAADVYVNLQDPTHPISEFTFPSKLLDFMSVGGLIVSTDMSDLRADFDDMFHFVPDEGSASKTIEETVNTYQTGDEDDVSRRGQQWIREHCGHERVGMEIVSLLNDA